MKLIDKNILHALNAQRRRAMENTMKEKSMENFEQKEIKSPLQRRNERKGEGGRGML